MRGDGIRQRNTVRALFVINSTVEQSNNIGDMSAAIAPRKPMELMLPTASMVDRRRESRALIASALNPRGCRCVLVTGLSGVGKTTLVRTWACRFSRFFPAGVINVDFAEGRKGGAAPVADLQRGKVNSLYGAERFSDADDEAVLRAYRARTERGRMLIVLENVTSIHEIARFRPVLARVSVVVSVTEVCVSVGRVAVSHETVVGDGFVEVAAMHVDEDDLIVKYMTNALHVRRVKLPVAELHDVCVAAVEESFQNVSSLLTSVSNSSNSPRQCMLSWRTSPSV